MYDVLYLDAQHHCNVVAAGLNQHAAARIARAESRRRRAGRMFLTGSAAVPRVHAVLIIRSGP